MKHEIAGTTIDLGNVVWTFDLWKPEPILHAGELRAFPNGEGAEIVTRCGQRTDRSPNGLVSAAALPPRHAIRIGRPCMTCWPALRAQRSLFTRPRRPRPIDVDQETLL